MASVPCRLCARPVPSLLIESGGENFCCIGCREVFDHFGARISSLEDLSEPFQKTPEIIGSELFVHIDGMHCSSCEFLVSKMAMRIDGVVSISSNFATSTARIIFDPSRIDEAHLLPLLRGYGYSARLNGHCTTEFDDRLPLLRAIAATSLAAVIMMAYLAFYYPIHLGIADYQQLEPVGNIAFVAVPIFVFVLTTVLVAVVGWNIFRGAWIGVRSGVANMDVLLAIAILAAYFYSVVQLAQGSLDLYFDVAATIVTVVTVGRYFELTTRNEATHELSKLLDAASTKARVRNGTGFSTRELSELRSGDQVVVYTGEVVPIDGTILSGTASIDESFMTGEPFPVRRKAGDTVMGGGVLTEGKIELGVGDRVESQLATLSRIMWQAQSAIAGAQSYSDKIARIFIPAVLVLAAIATTTMLIAGYSLEAAGVVGLTTLIVSCPCTFGLANPLTSAVAVSAALKRGIILTSADVFDAAPRIDSVVLDKTGTLSSGRMAVSKTYGGDEVVALAAAIERHSDHPIARAIATLSEEYEADKFISHIGRGATGRINQMDVAVGSLALFSQLDWEIPTHICEAAATIGPDEGVISYVGWNRVARGFIVTSDEPRPEWKWFVGRLRERVRVILLTGAASPGNYQEFVDEVYAGIPPEAKATVVQGLRSNGTVVMIGDGSNDAPALAAANLGIAFGSPTGLAAQAADIVIPGGRLDRVFDAFDIVAATRRRVRKNLGWALLYNGVAIPLALSGHLNPLFAALAMMASSLLVVRFSTRPYTLKEVSAADLIPPPRVQSPHLRSQSGAN